jgi:hypothetical protein
MIDHGSQGRRSPWVAFALIGLLGLAWCGCAKKTPMGTVQGKVTLNDAPYGDAAVVFLSMETGKAGTNNINADGTFNLKDPLPVGVYKAYLAPKVDAGSAEPKPVTTDKSVPEKYWNEASTDISIEVKAGPNDVKVELRKP